MKPGFISDLRVKIEDLYREYQNNRLKKFNSLDFKTIAKEIKEINIYLPVADGYLKLEDLVKRIVLDKYIRSNATYFGTFMEELVRWIMEQSDLSVKKSDLVGMDIESADAIISMKSSWNWNNSDQTKSMIRNFQASQEKCPDKALINLCMSGIDRKPEKTKDGVSYLKLCGGRAWEYIVKKSDKSKVGKIDKNSIAALVLKIIYETHEKFLEGASLRRSNEQSLINSTVNMMLQYLHRKEIHTIKALLINSFDEEPIDQKNLFPNDCFDIFDNLQFKEKEKEYE